MRPGQRGHRGYISPSQPSSSRAWHLHGDVLSKWVPVQNGALHGAHGLSRAVPKLRAGTAGTATSSENRREAEGALGRRGWRLKNPDGQTESLGVTQETCGTAGAEHRHGSAPSPPDEPPREPGCGRTPGTAQRSGCQCPRARVCCSSQLQGGFTSMGRGKVRSTNTEGFLKKPEAGEGGMQPE